MANWLLWLFSKEYRELQRLLGTHPNADARLGYRAYRELRTWYNRGNDHAKAARFREAIECYDRALSIVPFFAGAWFNKGVALDELRRYDEAIACYDRALEVQGSADACINKGISLVHLARFREALECFEQAKRLGAPEAERLIDMCRRDMQR